MDYEKDLEKLSGYERKKYISNISDENIRFSLLGLLDDYYKADVISSFSSEKLKVESIKMIEMDYYKKGIISTLSDIKLIDEALNYVNNEFNKVSIIEEISSEENRASLLGHLSDERKKVEIISKFSSDEIKELQLMSLTDDSCKAKVIVTLKDENKKYNYLSGIKEDSEKANIIESFSDKNLFIKAISLVESSSYKANLIKSLNDDNIALSLLNLLDDYYKADVVSTFSSEKLKLESIKLIESDYLKKQIINTFSDIKSVDEALNYINNEYSRGSIIEEISSEEDRVSLLGHLSDERKKAEIISKFSSDEIKELQLMSLTDDSSKATVIVTLKDENKKYDYLSVIKEDSEKVNIIETFSDKNLFIKAISLIESSSYKANLIKSLNDDNVALSLLNLLDDFDKRNIISAFSSDELKLEGLQLLDGDYGKSDIIKSFTQNDFVEKSLAFVEDDYYKRLIIMSFDDDVVKSDLLKYVSAESERACIISSLNDDSIKIKLLSTLTKDSYKANVIASLKDDNDKYNFLKQLSHEFYKVNIIASLKDENLFISSINELKHESNKAEVLIKLSDDNLKYKYLSLLKDDSSKVKVVNSMTDEVFKIKSLTKLEDEKEKVKVINNFKDERLRLDFLPLMEKSESKFLIIANISSDDIKNDALTKIDNYKEVMRGFFKEGRLDLLYHFDKKILLDVFSEKDFVILREYQKISNDKIRDLYSGYIVSNYDSLNMQNIDKISNLLIRIEMSNSSELQAFGDLVASQVLKHEDPLKQFSKVEDIFVKNNIPYVGKVFEVFKLLHSNERSYDNYSPLLSRFKGSRVEKKMMDMIIFNDLLKCSFGSNNRNLKEFLVDIEKGNIILTNVMKNRDLLNLLDESEKISLGRYLDRIEIIMSSYEEWRIAKEKVGTKRDLGARIDEINNKLSSKGNDFRSIPDIIIRKLCGVAGIKTLDDAKMYFKKIVEDADKRNREMATGDFTLEEGDFVKGINEIKYLPRILQNGSVAKEFLGESSDSDLTPLDTDLARILVSDIRNKKPIELGKIISSTISSSYGRTWFVLKNDPERIEVTRDSSNEYNRNLSSEFSKLEAFKTASDGHYGIRTGFPTSEISYIVSEDNFDIIGLEIAMNGFYIPVVNTKGELIFTPEMYDDLRNKMSGLRYYDEGWYRFSDNLVNDDVKEIAEKIEESSIQTNKKRELINSIIGKSLVDMGLVLKDRIDGDLSEGIVELIDTGSTGRGTNKPGEGDFDFMMRIDKMILSNPEKLEELKKSILKGLDKENTTQITDKGDFRLKDVSIVDGINVDVDITFTGKNDKVSYSTDMCLQERLETIKRQDPEKHKYVVANILLAKQILKEGDCYKPNRGEVPQGGLGGVGVENWILQNGGSFIDAARSFVKAADGRSFQEFKKVYKIWDFGQNHMAERDNYYAHDEFVSRNMSSDGYNKMVSTLNKFLNQYDYEEKESKRMI